MTDSNLPAAVQPTAALVQRPDVAQTDTDSWIGVLQNIGHLAELINGTEFVPKSLRNSAPAVAAAIMYGREVGLPPMTSLTQTHVIEGKPAMSAEAMRAMVLAGGHDLVVEQTTGALCTMRARRRNTEQWTELTWTIDMARAAGVAGKQVWKAYPRQMLQARCTTELVRLVFPDVIHGFRSVEELEDHGEVERAVEAATAPKSTSRVARKGAAAKKTAAAAPALPAPPQERPMASQGPPLPGEDGFDGPGAQQDQEKTSAGVGEASGEAAEPASAGGGEGEPVNDAAGSPSEGDKGGEEIPAPVTSEERPSPRASSRAQHRLIFARLEHLDVGEDERKQIVGGVLGRTVESFNGLTVADAKTVIDTLARVETREALDQLLAAAADAEAEREANEQ